MKQGFVIAIDGPVASGKGTIAPLLAEKLHGFYLQTGAMYRAVAWYCLHKGIDLYDSEKVVAQLPEINIRFTDGRIVIQEQDVTEKLHDETISRGSSRVAVIPEVREYLVPLQQQLAEEKQQQGLVVVAEGRDTATKVFPEADLALFLTATIEVRAKRRQNQILQRTGIKPAIEKVLEDVRARDRQDSERSVDPLVSEPEKYGYTVIDNSNLNEEETLSEIVKVLTERNLL